MNYQEIKGDLFKNLKNDDYIVHSVSQDGAMGRNSSGKILPCFATEVMKRYPNNRELFLKRKHDLHDAVVTNNIINLISKKKYWAKPNYSDVKETLLSLKEIVMLFNINNIIMPKIESGMNKLEWCKIRKIIFDIFNDVDVNITVYYL